MKLTKYLAAAAVSAAFVVAPVSAATMGMADLAITGLIILNSNNAPVTNGIVIQNENRTGTANSNFNNAQGTGAGLGNIFSTTIGGTVDVKNRCAGPSCGAGMPVGNYPGGVENNFTAHLPAPSGNYALGDMYIAGTALGVTGANGLTRADSSVMSPGNAGSANATIANSATAVTTFSVGTTLQAKFALGFNAYVAAFVNAINGVSGSSLGTISWTLSLQEVIGNVSTTIMNWSPAEINDGVTSSDISQNSIKESSGTILSNLVTLTGGRTYKLTINQASNSIASEVRAVPEPGSMVLIGLGLLALGAASRRKAAK
ncbi:PEP-CTERM sorting domain-containing protein [Massilia sp. CCM 8695]|uniref:PEP-CTERM sorting domain-containing protein n=1 Tax=Massilia frigida TaxID=2609281 RepID=A0ABX0N403_9BURK|nr:EDSAP-1 family PEP-CTERM protein [Massilia frigida]NHZ78011.1 PEP-CTERM sorting domain-containing protein [Massilia frigida]